ncbi:hypothetical protein TNCV_1441161 [Trichonephila clavipes]|uniref:Uncharacterized protein n=1 Tax=Trichonephila clavipes TaxID=2585209 RepID=A0A8X6RRX1_TRICX|nr:hypothetical protein TNCV_1441161 [Trichonephila clavipes]
MAPWPRAPVIPQLVDRKTFRDNRWPNDAFPPFVPGVSQYLLRCQGCIWWPAEQKICRKTKITSKEHLGWGIAGGLVNGTPGKKAISCPSPVDYSIPGERGCSGWSD